LALHSTEAVQHHRGPVRGGGLRQRHAGQGV